MKTRTSPKPTPVRSAARVHKPEEPAAERFVINGVAWDQYDQMVELFAENRLFMTYDDGRLELRMPLQEHEEAAEFLNGMINVICLLLGIKMSPVGSMTFRSLRAKKGLEPDKCYYIQNVATVLGRQIDLAVDPPPDLAIEIEITSSIIPRLPIYRQLGIPELWRYNGKMLTIEVLERGDYMLSPRSLAIPQLTAKLLLQWLKIGKTKGYPVMVQTVMEWCKKQR